MLTNKKPKMNNGQTKTEAHQQQLHQSPVELGFHKEIDCLFLLHAARHTHAQITLQSERNGCIKK